APTPPGRRHPGAGVTHLHRGEQARARGPHAVCRWSGVVGRDSDIPRTGDAAVAGPRSPVPLPQGSPAGTACAPLACSKEIVLRERHGTRPTRLCQHHFYGVIAPRRWHWDMRRNAAMVHGGRRAMPPYCPAGDGLWFQEPAGDDQHVPSGLQWPVMSSGYRGASLSRLLPRWRRRVEARNIALQGTPVLPSAGGEASPIGGRDARKRHRGAPAMLWVPLQWSWKNDLGDAPMFMPFLRADKPRAIERGASLTSTHRCTTVCDRALHAP